MDPSNYRQWPQPNHTNNSATGENPISGQQTNDCREAVYKEGIAQGVTQGCGTPLHSTQTPPWRNGEGSGAPSELSGPNLLPAAYASGNRPALPKPSFHGKVPRYTSNPQRHAPTPPRSAPEPIAMCFSNFSQPEWGMRPGEKPSPFIIPEMQPDCLNLNGREASDFVAKARRLLRQDPSTLMEFMQAWDDYIYAVGHDLPPKSILQTICKVGGFLLGLREMLYWYGRLLPGGYVVYVRKIPDSDIHETGIYDADYNSYAFHTEISALPRNPRVHLGAGPSA